MKPVRRVVIDTGTLIGAALREGSKPSLAYRKALHGFEVCVSSYTLGELERVLRYPKFDRYLSLEERLSFLAGYQANTMPYEVTLTVDDCRDPKDNPFLALALTVQADLLISSDPDLRTLTPYRGIPIISPAEFLELS